ncbi:hypothetical protein OPT61_g4414 [Boeremia exigua]|uniref:Uncharacterized protein n=1 Tax=Boeremia exigua TaxID=749465 RepID=A0ACC2IE66_9PLEO|nr:hypothetical protein OPT61_g4414 [Boeremia exigua]
MPVKRRRNGFRDAESAWTYLVDKSGMISLRGHITRTEISQFEMVTKQFQKSEKTQPVVKQLSFLNRVRKVDLDYYTFCAIAFSQTQIDSTREPVLITILDKIKQECGNTTVMSPSLQSLLVRLRNGEIKCKPAKPKRQMASDPKRWIHFNEAKCEGARRLFGDYLTDKIERTKTKDSCAVTLQMPTWPPDYNVECLISIGLRQDFIVEIAEALFKVKVVWLTGAVQIVHESGLIETCEGKLKIGGVLDDDIRSVFGPEVHEAINACYVRTNELAEGRFKTQCVSMSLWEGNGWIDLTMHLRKGFEAKSQLYEPEPNYRSF